MAEKTARESVVEVMVNGVVHVIDDTTAREHHIDGSFTLVKFLRDVLELKGTKLGVGGCVAQSPPPLMHPRIHRHDARTLTCMHEVCGQHCHHCWNVFTGHLLACSASLHAMQWRLFKTECMHGVCEGVRAWLTA
jgi:hypothetical protein